MPESFCEACKCFVYTEDLISSGKADDDVLESPAKPLHAPSSVTPILKRGINHIDSDDGWVVLSHVGTLLSNLAPDFDLRNYGFSKLSDLVRKTGAFNLEKPKNGAMRIRIRQVKTRTSETTAIKKT